MERISDKDLEQLAELVEACSARGEGWQYGDSAPEGGFVSADALVAEMGTVARKTFDRTPGSHTTHLWSVHMPDPLEEGASVIICHTGNGPTSEANARLLSCAPAALAALIAEVEERREAETMPSEGLQAIDRVEKLLVAISHSRDAEASARALDALRSMAGLRRINAFMRAELDRADEAAL